MDIVERLRTTEVLITHGQLISPVAHEAADEIERLRDEIYNLKLAVAGGEDAPGLANLVGLEDVIMWRKLWTDEIERLRKILSTVIKACEDVNSPDRKVREEIARTVGKALKGGE